MSKKYLINVTARDIKIWVDKVIKKDNKDPNCNCAVAKAVHRHKNLKNMKINDLYIYRASINKSMYREMFRLPYYITNNIYALDSGKIIAPFKFIIEVK